MRHLIIIIITGIVLSGTFYMGMKYERRAMAEKQLNTVVKNDKARKDKKQEVNNLDDPALVRAFCKWVFDVPYDECVRTYLPVD